MASNCSSPLLVFINPKSGGKEGSHLLTQLQCILNPGQVHDIAKEGGPTQGLQMFKDVRNCRVICCGGDGTVGWVLETMDKVQMATRPAVGIIPLGTGNDLSRSLGWGGEYKRGSIQTILDEIERARIVIMDRWHITVQNFSAGMPDCSSGSSYPSVVPYDSINNYFSVGVDAAFILKFHMEREQNPDSFHSRTKNMLRYFKYAACEQHLASCMNLHEYIDIVCDGVPLDLNKGLALQGVVLLNIPYAHAGSNLWGHCPNAQQDIGDKILEVVGLANSFQVGIFRTGLHDTSGSRLAQCRSITITTKKTWPMQIDGEPWMQPPCKITITHKNQVPMLMGPHPEKGPAAFKRFLNKLHRH